MIQETDVKGRTKTLRLERVFLAASGRLWQAWTDPEILARWFGPFNVDNDVHEMDVRPEGRFRMAMNDEAGNKFPVWGEYLVVDPPKELVFIAEANEIAPLVSTVHVRFEEEGFKTRLRFSQFGLPSDLAHETGEGWQASWDKLDVLLGEKTTRKGDHE